MSPHLVSCEWVELVVTPGLLPAITLPPVNHGSQRVGLGPIRLLCTPLPLIKSSIGYLHNILSSFFSFNVNRLWLLR